MFKKMVSSPHTHSGKLTARIMLWVIAAMLPALLTQIYYFGMGVLEQSALAIRSEERRVRKECRL